MDYRDKAEKVRERNPDDRAADGYDNKADRQEEMAQNQNMKVQDIKADIRKAKGIKESKMGDLLIDIQMGATAKELARDHEITIQMAKNFLADYYGSRNKPRKAPGLKKEQQEEGYQGQLKRGTSPKYRGQLKKNQRKVVSKKKDKLVSLRVKEDTTTFAGEEQTKPFFDTYRDMMQEEVANITVDKQNKISKSSDQNAKALLVHDAAKRMGLKVSMVGKHVRVKGTKKKIHDFMMVVIGKSSYGDPTEQDTSTPQIDKMLSKGFSK